MSVNDLFRNTYLFEEARELSFFIQDYSLHILLILVILLQFFSFLRKPVAFKIVVKIERDYSRHFFIKEEPLEID